MRSLLLISLLSIGILSARAQLQPGSIVFTSVNFNCDEAFNFYENTNGTWSFAALQDIPAGTVLFFTNTGWNDQTGDFFTPSTERDAVISLTLTSTLTAGTVVTFTEVMGMVDGFDAIVSGSFSTGTTAFPRTTAFEDKGMVLMRQGNTAGDQILCYTTPNNVWNNPTRTFITAIQFTASSLQSGNPYEAVSSINGWHKNPPDEPATSMLPAGLVNGVNAVSVINPGTGVIYSGYRYDCLLIEGSSDALRSAIYDYNNWSVSGITTLPANLDPCIPEFTVNSAVPVTLNQFIARIGDDENTVLEWSTLTELNNERFEILHSLDGRNFHHLLTVPGKGNSTVLQTYTASHVKPVPGLHYYQLVQYDLDGRKTSHGIRTVRVRGEKLKVAVYPNPVQGVATIRIGGTHNGTGTLIITDVHGKVIRKLTVVREQISLDMSGVPGGLYLLRYQQGDEVRVEKLFVR